jgi:hypothetical protein
MPDRRNVKGTRSDQKAPAKMGKLEVDQNLNVTVSKRAMMPSLKLPVCGFAIRMEFPRLRGSY